MQKKHYEWNYQWETLADNSEFLFEEWIAPYTLEDFCGKTVVDCGCGSGQHIDFIAPYALKVVGIDLNTTEIGRKRNRKHRNVEFIEGDIATVDLGEKFDIVYSIGVIHHTDDVEASFNNIKQMAKPGGTVITWTYSHEGNFLNRAFLEPLKKRFILEIKRKNMLVLARILTVLMYIPIYTVYLLPLKFLPFYEYFNNFRKLSLGRNLLNVFDKLNAPQTFFIKKERLWRWFNSGEFDNIDIHPYSGVSWHASGRKKE